MNPSTGTTYNSSAMIPPISTASTGGGSAAPSRASNTRRPIQASATALPNNPAMNSAKARNGIRTMPITVTTSSRNTIGLHRKVNSDASTVRPGRSSIVRTQLLTPCGNSKAMSR